MDTTGKKRTGWWVGAVLAVLVIAGAGVWASRRGKGEQEGASFATRRGALDITVLEGGSVQAIESQEVKCEVRVGYQGTKILKIVEEGYLVTDEDVKNGKVLVELDSSEITKQQVQQEIQFESASASLTDAQQAYDIQLNQNFSDIKAAEQKARFARLDLDRFLGGDVASAVIDEIGVEKMIQDSPGVRSLSAPLADAPAAGAPPSGTNAQPEVIIRASAFVDRKPAAKPEGAQSTEVKPASGLTAAVDFSRFARIEALGDGEAKQKLRKFQDDHMVAQKELEQARATLEGTRRLFAGGFVTRTDLQRDEIAHENNRLKVQTAETARDLFLRYEFIKTAEETLSKHTEALRELDRARRAAVSKLAQASAKLKSAQAQYNVQLRQRKELGEQLDKCVIKATKSGLVVYGAGGDQSMYFGGEERIREGATVRERQSIITIPDMNRMSVRVAIHESYIKKVKAGQKARVTLDAFPDKTLTGRVSKVGVLPDSQNRWMNPDLKVYLTTIAVDGSQDWIKPGMTAKVEIFVDHLENVTYVPLQAVGPSDGKQVCFVIGGSQTGQRQVEVGQFNDEFIEIKSGLSEGDRVLLKQPVRSEPSADRSTNAPRGTIPAASPQPASAGQAKQT